MAHIAIVGLGAIGGSLGLALHHGKVSHQIIGHDMDLKTSGKAQRLGAVDRAEWNLPNTVRGAGLVIVAVPLDALRTVFGQIAPHLEPGAVVTDTAGCKQQVLAWAAECLPEGVSFVGGHPIPRRPATGIDEAAADLFHGRVYCITPARSATPEAISLVSGIAGVAGARPFYVDPVEHDSFEAIGSQLPFLAGAALIRTAASDSGWRDGAQVADGAFADATRPARGNPTTNRAACLANRATILRWLDAYREELGSLREMIASPATTDAELDKVFQQALDDRIRWEVGPQAEPAAAFPKAGEQLREMFFGRWGERKRK